MKWFCRHDWPKWSAIVSTYNGPYQYRACVKCNKVSRRKVCLDSNGVNLAAWNADKTEN
jgi:hypothetical protein